uniref:Uncharacterized protein n=1 Tax=Noccaea caerulescens TaxID=107243 RepID=A0A1J3JLP2_NOCCA
MPQWSSCIEAGSLCQLSKLLPSDDADVVLSYLKQELHPVLVAGDFVTSETNTLCFACWLDFFAVKVTFSQDNLLGL